MTVLKPKPVSTKQLSYDATAQHFVGEISSTYGFGRVYDDACDEGLTLVSASTGREVVFVVDRTETDEEGDITAWHLVPADTVRLPQIKGVTMTLFND